MFIYKKYIHTYIHVYIYIYVYIHIHTHIHIHILILISHTYIQYIYIYIYIYIVHSTKNKITQMEMMNMLYKGKEILICFDIIPEENLYLLLIL